VRMDVLRKRLIGTRWDDLATARQHGYRYGIMV
jgi:hypothetical protein